MTEVNVPLLRKVLDHITAHPEEWHQADYVVPTACGTAYCVAGWIVHFDDETELNVTEGGFLRDVRYRGELVDIEDAAADAIGVPVEMVSSTKGGLFYDWNSLPDLWRHASALTGGEIEVPDGLLDGTL